MREGLCGRLLATTTDTSPRATYCRLIGDTKKTQEPRGSDGHGFVATRKPAQYGRRVVRRTLMRGLAAMVGLFTATGLLGLTFGFDSRVFLVAEAVLISALLIGNHLFFPRVDRRIRGNDGERHVGKILEGLASDGWRVLHDIPFSYGNIDHVLIGPAGLIALETKSHGGKRKVADIEPSWLSQAHTQRKWLENVTGLKADCLLVFSRAYLDRPVSRQRGVLVLPARMLAGHLERRTSTLTPERVAEVHEQLVAALAPPL
jgi:hypothetical protein